LSGSNRPLAANGHTATGVALPVLMFMTSAVFPACSCVSSVVGYVAALMKVGLTSTFGFARSKSAMSRSCAS
jgi:hypothetical protein